MTTDAFICALLRFISRRGPIQKIWSDHGTNLVGANNELKEIISNLDQQKIEKFALSRGFHFHFHPPQASEHGGH